MVLTARHLVTRELHGLRPWAAKSFAHAADDLEVAAVRFHREKPEWKHLTPDERLERLKVGVLRFRNQTAPLRNWSKALEETEAEARGRCFKIPPVPADAGPEFRIGEELVREHVAGLGEREAHAFLLANVHDVQVARMLLRSPECLLPVSPTVRDEMREKFAAALYPEDYQTYEEARLMRESINADLSRVASGLA